MLGGIREVWESWILEFFFNFTRKAPGTLATEDPNKGSVQGQLSRASFLEVFSVMDACLCSQGLWRVSPREGYQELLSDGDVMVAWLDNGSMMSVKGILPFLKTPMPLICISSFTHCAGKVEKLATWWGGATC